MENSKRLQKDLKQVKSLLAQLRKAKLKCLQLCENLNKDLPNLQKYEILEVRCTRTAETLDKEGLTQLQNQLAKSLTELYEAEREMMFESQKNSFKKIAPSPPPRRQRQYYGKQEIGPFKVPTYFSRPEPGANKVQRIANYIESIGKSMDSLRKSMEGQNQWDPKDFLTYEPQYVNLQRKIEQYRMRDEQIIFALQKKVDEEVKRLLSEGDKVEDEGEYYVMKVSKAKIDNYAKQSSMLDKRPEQGYHSVSAIESRRRISTSKKTKLEQINEEGVYDSNQYDLKQTADNTQNLDLHVNSFQRGYKQPSRVSKVADNSQMDYDENGNFVYMVKKVSPDSRIDASIISSISSLRSMRKKVFDDDIWDEFQKL